MSKVENLKILSKFISPKNIVMSIRFLIKNDTSAWYTFLGDDVLENLNENFECQDKDLWLNIGYWKDAKKYPEACSAMATYLANSAKLSHNDKILDVGFGFGDQDLLWSKNYHVKKIMGINISPLQVDLARKRVKKLGLENQIDFQVGSATDIPFQESSFDKVMALECAFHFHTREKFLQETFRILRPGGRLAAADMLPLPNKKPKLLTSWFVRQRCGWPKENLYDRQMYCEKLKEIGFMNITMDSIRNYVYPGMYKYSRQRYAGMKREDIIVELSESDITNCNGVAFWEKSMGVSDYVIFTADKPF